MIKKSSEELTSLAIQGNGPAFTALWDKHIERLRTYLRLGMKIKNEADIDDICSRSFEKAFRKIHDYNPEMSQFITWLKTIARNTALDLIAREARLHPAETTIYIDNEQKSNGVEFIADQKLSPIESLIKNEDLKKSENCIDKLPKLYREAARKRLIMGMQYKEIAEDLNLNVNTVKTRVSRAKDILSDLAETL